jgi:hypothetical protein
MEQNQKREETINFEKIRRILNFPHTTHNTQYTAGEIKREQETAGERERGRKEERGKKGPRGKTD